MSVRLLDGGVGQEIFRRLGQPKGGWSQLAAIEHPSVVQSIHEEFLTAGSEIITADTYGLGRWHMNQSGLADRFAEANFAAVQCAAAAREKLNPGALLAGAIGPVRLSYDADMVPPPEVVEREVLEQALLLAKEVDLFICETMTSGAEAAACARAALAANRPVWVGLTLHETGPPVLRSGEPIKVAVEALKGLDIEAVLLNCTSPEAVDAGIGELAAASHLPFGAYANAFLPIPSDAIHEGEVSHVGARKDVTPQIYADHAERWIKVGATIVGGCCEVGHDHIAEIARRLARHP
ncbi:MAG: homocysteine S-methyltransferase family protein [Pseudomonadota bacterium]